MTNFDEKIKESKKIIPEMSSNLKESIIDEFDDKKRKVKTLHLKMKKILLSSLSILLIVSISTIVVMQNKKMAKSMNDIADVGDYSDPSFSDSIGKTKAESSDKYIYYSSSSEESIESSTPSDDVSDISIYAKKEREVLDSSTEVITEEFDDQKEYKSGQLTSSALNDNDEYEYFKNLLMKGQEAEGLFYQYNKDFDFNLQNRIKVTVDKGLSGKVKLISNEEIIYEATIDKSGNAYLFNNSNQECDLIIEGNGKKYTFNNIKTDIDLKGQLNELRDEHKDIIELMFVIDATGSMGDEINYLKAEIKDVITEVKNNNANSVIYLAIMMYRDADDTYITKYSDFTTDIDFQQEFLKEQVADGGGDYEEAVTVALNEAINKKWSNDDSTKIIVHVADAPAHDDDIKDLIKINKEMSKKGIRVITVASSGVDKKTEYFMRTECIMTGGVYGFLTNDSGIGNNHIEATTKDPKEVEYLNSMLIRLINGIHNGEFKAPVNYKQEIK